MSFAIIKVRLWGSVANINEKLWAAAEGGHAIELEALLREPGCDALTRNNRGWTALMWAAYCGHESCVRLLLPVSDASSTDENGLTALMRAAHEGHEACVGRLRTVSDALARDNDGATALMRASFYGHEACMKLLLPVSNARAKDRSGLTASAHAQKVGHESLAQFIDAYILAQSENAAIKAASKPGAPRGKAAPRV